ncbi:MAG: hypothetical protein J5515_06760, partial [Lachnospiraceae bacterium]|nr:hypothetical protein [Lachnospiraceae bacterium]
ENEIGAAAYALGGAAEKISVGSKTAPFALTIQGCGSFGGVSYEAETTTIKDSSVYVRANVQTDEY